MITTTGRGIEVMPSVGTVTQVNALFVRQAASGCGSCRMKVPHSIMVG